MVLSRTTIYNIFNDLVIIYLISLVLLVGVILLYPSILPDFILSNLFELFVVNAVIIGAILISNIIHFHFECKRFEKEKIFNECQYQQYEIEMEEVYKNREKYDSEIDFLISEKFILPNR